MNLNELKLRSFRNYREIAAQFDPGVNLIVGDNAQGKTNLLHRLSALKKADFSRHAARIPDHIEGNQQRADGVGTRPAEVTLENQRQQYGNIHGDVRNVVRAVSRDGR